MKRKVLSIIVSVLLLIATAASAAVLFSSCASNENTVTLNVYNWGEYMSVGSKVEHNVNKAFEAYYSKTYNVKVKVNYTTFASNEELYAKLKSGASTYDVIIPSDYMVERLAAENLLADIKWDNIPNYEAKIAEQFKGLAYDKDNKYSVPYTYGVLGIIYNTAKVSKEDVESEGWGILWNEKYKGSILMPNNSRDAFSVAQYKLGLDVNSTNVDDWKVALEELKKQKETMKPQYVMDEIFNKMEGGAADIAVYYAGDYLTMKEDAIENKIDLGFYQPAATNLFVDAFCVPAASKNQEIAERYINFMLEPEQAIANANQVRYASPNSAVYSDDGYKEKMGDGYDVLYHYDESKYGSAAEFFADNYDTYSFRNLTPEMLTEINTLWDELKIGGGTNLLTVILIVVAVALVIVAVITTVVVRRKKRNEY